MIINKSKKIRDRGKISERLKIKRQQIKWQLSWFKHPAVNSEIKEILKKKSLNRSQQASDAFEKEYLVEERPRFHILCPKCVHIDRLVVSNRSQKSGPL